MADIKYIEKVLRDKFECFNVHDKFAIMAKHIASLTKKTKNPLYESRIVVLENEVGVLKNAIKELEQYIFELNKMFTDEPVRAPEKQ